ncbi:MAG: ATP-binding protein, partial [Acidobacteria bacterium]|nr:ATP-binding protein [Acidobacteriota bacterium]
RPPGVRAGPMPPAILVEVDADRMRTVFRNLFENAIKYSLPDSRPVTVSAVQNGEHVVIRVTDDGPGIPARDVPRLFEPFFRVDRSRSRKAGGYGLGLSISKRIVRGPRRHTYRRESCRAWRLLCGDAADAWMTRLPLFPCCVQRLGER